MCLVASRHADFQYNKLPDADERLALGKAVGLSARAVQVWFQNRRQRQKSSGEPPAPNPDEQRRVLYEALASASHLPSANEHLARQAALQPQGHADVQA